ncbi:MAG: diacylglycerol/lipid kinase family protein [Cellulosilyticaceae bacterium]
MKHAVLLYNPKAGNKQITEHLDYIVKRIQGLGYTLTLHRSAKKGDIEMYIMQEVTTENTDMILVSGGDGTVNECINGILKKGLDLPLGILPLGTANDFARTANIPSHIRGALDLIQADQIKYVDVGQVNDRYFINVCNMGLFSNVSHIIDIDLKNKFGKLAYYVKGIEELQSYNAMSLRITTESRVKEDKYVLVLIFNGQGAGGFNKLAKDASIEDGYLDAVCIKEVELHDIPRLFLKVLQGEHLGDDKVDYMRCNHLKIECLNENETFVTDVDGEEGPQFPLEIKIIPNKLPIYCE